MYVYTIYIVLHIMPWPARITENLEGRLWTLNCLPDSQSDKMQRLQGCLCRTSQSHFLAKKFIIAEMGSNYTTCRRRYKYPPGRPGCNPRGDRANKKLQPTMRLMAIVPINISTQGCKMTEPGMMNIYWTKIKLRPPKQFI